MASKTLLLAGCALALTLAACNEKPEAPATPAADAAAPPAQSMAVGEPSPGTPTPSDPSTPALDGEAAITSPPTAVAGANITVTWTGPGNGADYIDVVPRGFADTSGEISYAYVRNSNGTVTVRAPTTAGEYDVRYVLDLSGARSVKMAAPLTVSGAQATLQAPAAAETGQALNVAWTGPNGPGDYVDLVKASHTATSGEITYAYTSAGSPAKIEAPSAAGDYLIRYILEGPGGRKVSTASPLKVTASKATLTAPASAEKGQAFKVDWTGPRSSGDYIDLVKKGVTATSGETDYFYVGQTASGELTAPEAGDYEVRYVLEAPGGRAVLATRPIAVR
jgi:Ca-activated chloride channel family protein